MISLLALVPYSRRSSALLGAGFAIVLGFAPVVVSTSALAELRVGGNANAVTIDAQNTPIREILDTLGKTFDVRFQSTANLEKQITGTYEGSLSKVLIRILEGYSVVMKTSKEGIQVTVLGTKNASGVAASAVSPASTVVVADTVAQAAPPALAGNNVETPLPTTASSNASTTLMAVAEGPAPPVPTAGAADSANTMQVRPSTVAPPMPVVGSTQAAFPIGKATTSLPPVPSSSGVQTPVPQPGAGTAPAPLAK
jgi:hypothetical protein